MPSFQTLAWSLLALTGVALVPRAVPAQSAPPPVIAREMRQVQDDLAMGGIRKLGAAWYACIDRARESQDANAAEACVVYGYGALLVGQSGASQALWMRHLTEDIVAPGQNEMLEIMGIPPGPRQAWLDRYRRWVAEIGAREASDSGPRDRSPPGTEAPGPSAVDGESHDPRVDLAKATEGKYPSEALRNRDVADAVRQLLGPALFARLRTYSFASPMEPAGRYTVGMACEPRACGVSEARFVFSANDVWVGVIDGRRLRL